MSGRYTWRNIRMSGSVPDTLPAMNDLWAALQTASLTLLLASGGVTLDIEVAIENIENATINELRETFAIYPGTKWCGAGDKAKNNDDLGMFRDTDMCCRDHDHCPDNIEVGDTKHGLKNDGRFTRSHCDCDKQFYDCLKKAGPIVSKKVGVTYFDVLGPKCFKLEYPVTGCAKRSFFPLFRCVQYKTDNTKAKKWQWFENPVYNIF